MNVTRRPLHSIERNRKEQIAELQRAHETKVQAAKAADTAWKREVEQATIDGLPIPPKPIAAMGPGEFVTPRLYVSNVTIERAAVLLQGRPSGLLLIADELSGLFLNMSRYSNGQDNEFWLESWNGGTFIVERAGRPAAFIDHLLIGITGGFQPDKLSRSLQGDRDGMYARILFAWPAEPGYQPLTDQCAEIEPEIVNALNRLIKLPMRGAEVFVPHDVELSDAARKEFEQFRQFLHSGKQGRTGREREWWSKGEAQVLRLAGTLAFMDWSMRGGPEPTRIDEGFIKSAILIWTDYFVPHSMAAVRCIGTSEQHVNERHVLLWIKANRKSEVSVRDIRRDALSQRLKASETTALLERLAKSGWLREATVTVNGPGRPPRRWLVNPKLQASDDAGNAEFADMPASTLGTRMKWAA